MGSELRVPVLLLRGGDEDRKVAACPLALACLSLLEAKRTAEDVVGCEKKTRILAPALAEFARELLGPQASREVLEGWVYVTLLHLVAEQA